jgi:hypothetical protein
MKGKGLRKNPSVSPFSKGRENSVEKSPFNSPFCKGGGDELDSPQKNVLNSYVMYLDSKGDPFGKEGGRKKGTDYRKTKCRDSGMKK